MLLASTGKGFGRPQDLDRIVISVMLPAPSLPVFHIGFGIALDDERPQLMMTFDEVKARHERFLANAGTIECGQGWAKIVDRFLTAVDPMMRATGSTVSRVHQDMGALRITDDYPQKFEPEFLKARLLAEFRSRTTCEECGEAGHMRKANGFYRCRCYEHSTAEERDQPPRPSWTISRDTSVGYLWYDPAADDVKIIAIEDLAELGMPQSISRTISGSVKPRS